MRPPLKGVSTPIPCPDRSTQQQQESIITQQIAALVERRKQLRQRGQGGEGILENKEERVPENKKDKVLPRIISDVQVAPPRRAVVVEAAQDTDGEWHPTRKSKKKKKIKDTAKETQLGKQVPPMGRTQQRQSVSI